jgi:biopolymer transport protein ExbD
MARLGRGVSTINANMTPMIDVTFLLIVFFVVVSQIVDRDVVPMDLPTPHQAVSGISEEPDRIVVNLVPSKGGEIASIVVAGHAIGWDEMDSLTAIVKSRMQSGASEVHLRADKATKYNHIHDAIEAIRAIGTTPRLQLVVNGDQP